MKTFIVTLMLALAASPLAARAVTEQEILESNAKALGGREALDKVADVVKEGKITIMPTAGTATEGTVKVITKTPNKAYMTQKLGTRVIAEGVNGKINWVYDSTGDNPGVREVVGARAEMRMQDAQLDNAYPANYAKVGVKMEFLGDDKFGDRPVYVIKMTRPYGNQTKEYIDKETGLLVKEQTSTSEIQYSDWRKVDGVLFAFKEKMIWPTQTIEVAYDSIKINTGVVDAVFDSPTGKVLP